MTAPPTEWKLGPRAIEERSFAIIAAEAGAHDWAEAEWTVVRRLIHTSADFEYVAGTVISPGAVSAGLAALRAGAAVVTDTKMALCGINAAGLATWGNPLVCLIGDEKTKARARETGSTRALAAVDLAHELYFKNAEGGLWVIGNAPTALFRLLEKLESEPDWPRPRLIVGLPVGFVNAVESKAALQASGHPHISNRSRKGGSNVAASVVNALIELARLK
ncbi:MAG: precorrin-8X methylmutase [Candidatus Adiutrix sp.]|jgi:precorrin-8X/cobalt-precorrin-8 methylmutase|nr:precorrin-8X methylmutase [Candidatus Adiutrix sp.]